MNLHSISDATAGLGGSLSGLSNGTNRLLSDLTGKKTNWRDQLKPAKFRDVAFGVFDSQIQFGRKVSIHEYPFRDGVWVEDLGRSARRISFSGFLVGNDCIQQRELLIQKCEEEQKPDDVWELQHPSLGTLSVSLAGEVTCVERWDKGRVFEIGFSFIEQGKRQYPTSQEATGDAMLGALSLVTTAGQRSFLQMVGNALKAGIAVAQSVVGTVQDWESEARHLVNDATSLVNYVQSLGGSFGRLFGQGTVRSSSVATSTQSLIAKGALARTTVQQAASAMTTAASALVPATGPTVSDADARVLLNNFASTLLALPAAMASVAPTPADGIRLVGGLLVSAPWAGGTNLTVPEAPPGAVLNLAQAIAALSTSAGSLLRRGCVIAQAQLAAEYQPMSREDAQAVLAVILATIDAEIAVAGDAGEDDVYNALRTLRTAVVQDLNSRASSLADLVTVASAASLPAPALAQRLYRDASRVDELVQEADPIHPAFMPTSFQALAR